MPNRGLYCQQLFGPKRAGEMSALIEAVTGEPCPCKRGLVCPLRARIEVVTIPVSVPAPRSDAALALSGLMGACG